MGTVGGILDISGGTFDTGNAFFPSGTSASDRKGYLDGANPYQLPAIWGNQDDFTNLTQPKFQNTTSADLREDWYYLWNGREDVDASWPLGRFHPQRWFIDKVGAAEGGSGAGIWDDGSVSYMQISYWGLGSVNEYNRQSNEFLAVTHQPTELKFAEALNTVGTQFRFKQDPDQIIYTITKVEIENSIWNYETPQGAWGYDDGGGICVGGSGWTASTCPPWRGSVQGSNIAGGRSFVSDLFTLDKKLTGGAPYNHRIRYTLTLDKIIGAEGVNSFHPIINHVDADGVANIKRGTQKYDTGLTHVTASKGGTPSGIEFYNLNSYWNASDNAGGSVYTQPKDSTDSWYTLFGKQNLKKMLD